MGIVTDPRVEAAGLVDSRCGVEGQLDRESRFGCLRCRREAGNSKVTDENQAAGRTRPLQTHETARLLGQLALIKRDSALGATSIAVRHRLLVHGAHLERIVRDLRADDGLYLHLEAIRAAIAAHHFDAVIAGCVAFEVAVEGKPLPVQPVAATPIAVAAMSPAHPANDNDHDPERVLPVPTRALEAPVREHTAPFPTNDALTASAMVIDTLEQLGGAIRAARARRRMTQQDVASSAGVGRRFVVELEAGKATSEISRVLAVCQAVGLTIRATAA